MLEKLLIVKYLNVKSNFCFLGPILTKELGNNTSISLSDGGNRDYIFSVSPQRQNISEDCVGINSVYAKLLGLNENSSLVLSVKEPLMKVDSFTIHPLRFDDFHVLDLLKNEVENYVLNQTSVVACNQELLIWIGENLNIPVKVVSVEPSSPGKLQNLTELVILPCLKINELGETEKYDPKHSKIGEFKPKNFAVDFFDIPERLSEKEKVLDSKMKSYFSKLENFVGRLVPYNNENPNYKSLLKYEFNILLNKNSVPSTWKKYSGTLEPLFCSLNIINNSSRDVFVGVFIYDDLNPIKAISKNIFVNANLLKIMNCDTGRKVLLTPLTKRDTSNEIEVHGEHDRQELKSILQNYLAKMCQNNGYILNADVPIELENSIVCKLKFKPDYVKYCCVNQEFLRNCRYTFVNEYVQKSTSSKKVEILEFVETFNSRKITQDIFENLQMVIKRNEKLGCYLITGNMGTGKTKLLEKLKQSLNETPPFFYSEIIQSKSLKGKTLDSLHKVFTTILERLLEHEPSILFLDDLHILCRNVQEGESLQQNSLYYDRISEMLYLLLISVIRNSTISIVATAESVEQLNKNIYHSRGTYLFEKVFHIGDLTKDDRMNIIAYFLRKYHYECDLDIFAQKTEGFVFQDLYDYCQRIIFQSVKDGNDDIDEEHFQKAMSQMVILAHSDIKLHSPGDKDFSNVGGLRAIKKLLGESLMWPLKYPNLFSSAPLRLQSGLLLYGPPGTGKTLLAGAAAKEYGVRLISIKGPELLSKYIGASEQAVRNVFLKAQNAKPCILFFDEFDSLAPRRGHDSTGVTDRVVNQFLTQMDGIESLNGVFVLAATSRPDLLDPALLRPGRLDKQIYCSLPDKDSRIDILNVLSKSLNLSDDVDFEEIALSAEGFSGADLQSVLYNAQLSTMEHLLSENNKDPEQPKQITQEILKSALQKTKPSLTEEEKRKYSLIYMKFEGKSNVDVMKPGTKASLA